MQDLPGKPDVVPVVLACNPQPEDFRPIEEKIVREWRKVKVPGHAEAVLDAARAL